MKEKISLIIVFLLLLSSIGFVGIAENTDIKNVENLKINDLQISSRISDYNDEYLKVNLKNNNDYIFNPGKPLIPKIIKHFELPFGATNIHVDVKIENIHIEKIGKEILPSPNPISIKNENTIFISDEKDFKIYSSNDIYPTEWFSYNIGCGLNSNLDRITHLSLNIYPIRYRPLSGILLKGENAVINIYYESPKKDIYQQNIEYDLLIISPSEFSEFLQPLVDHKNDLNPPVSTFLKTTEDIYDEFDGRDKPEQIKYFIKNAIEQWNIKYVLLVGGLKSKIFAKPKDDRNQGSLGWHLPVRYSNLRTYEKGYICDLYYADIYKEGGIFDDWDSNGNNIFAEWKNFNSDKLDLYPDVSLGRLACRDAQEVRDVVSKIINYEDGLCDPSWFNRIVGVTGDSFLDQDDLDFQWDVTGLSDGKYRIHAQSVNDEGEIGPIDIINIDLNRNIETSINFNHDDNLKIDSFPSPPIAEIVSISEGDVLGNSDFSYRPGDNEAYCNSNGWGNIDFEQGILHIRGKSYDPKLYGNITNIHVWITDDEGVVFSEWRNDTKTFAEGDWIVGETYHLGRGGAMYYMPDDFEKKVVSTSNGLFTSMSDVIDELGDGSGFLIFSVHGSPGSIGNHQPGIPGNRHESYINGLKVTNLFAYYPFFELPILPIDKITNNNKLPVTVISLGCHDSMFNISLVNSILDVRLHQFHTYGHPIAECLGWYLVKLPDSGSIATMGYTGYGWGNLGEWHTIGGLDGWISTEFFRQYGEEDKDILGDAYSLAISNYITHFKEWSDPSGDNGWDVGDQMTVEGWVLLGDPSLKMGGYS